MKKIGLEAGLVIAALFLLWCGSGDQGVYNNDGTLPPGGEEYRQEMRDFVQGISTYARVTRPGFIVIPQNGPELLTENGAATGVTVTAYLAAVTGVGREDIFYGYNADNAATSAAVRDGMIAFMDLAENYGIEVLSIDYCSSHALVNDSYVRNSARGYISFAADRRDLDDVPAYPTYPYNVNSWDITSLDQAKNFLYLINPGSFADKRAFLNAVKGTNYDLAIIDLFYNDAALTAAEISSLKTKANGGSRLIIGYLSIGEAEDYRYYWKTEWKNNPPSWLDEENPDWPGNYKVRYWEKDWQDIIYGNDNSYLKRILDAGFDGVYLDIIDAFEYFENK
ncbi:MAG: endo alpha-1,4 polygalactosaminidase [bacterium]|nr:endo alpha-1,4 polygalactosaminidase [bacterium]